jgi:sulfur carrier protein
VSPHPTTAGMIPTAASISITVNDQPRSVLAHATLADIVAALGLAGRKGIAAAVNGSVVPRSDWAARGLVGGDQVLVIQATQGG